VHPLRERDPALRGGVLAFAEVGEELLHDFGKTRVSGTEAEPLATAFDKLLGFLQRGLRSFRLQHPAELQERACGLQERVVGLPELLQHPEPDLKRLLHRLSGGEGLRVRELAFQADRHVAQGLGRLPELPHDPAGDAGYDWACWGEPAIDAGPTAADLDLAPPAGADRLIVEDASGLRSIAPGSTRVRVSLPAQLIYASGPTTAAVAGPLAGLPSETRTCIDGLVRSESAWGAGRDERFALAGEERSGIWAHPPERGQTRIAWLLKLPEGPMRLRTGAGVRALGGQVGFRIEVNGRTLWEHASSGGQPWQDADVDLATWAGKEALVELVTDSQGSGNSDWALWSTPALVDKRK